MLGGMLIGMTLLLFGWTAGWSFWNVPAMPLCFADLRTIAGAHDSLLQGYDPLTWNPGDPWGRSMNYPRIWLLAAELGFSQPHVSYVGVAFLALFVLGLFLALPRDLTKRTSLYLLAFLFSPSALLCMERGNTDMLIFFLLSAALFYLSRAKLPCAAALIFIGFILKLFPLFAFVCLLREKRSVWQKYAVFLAFLAGLYLLLTWDDLALIRQTTPPCYWRGYGVKTWCVLASRYLPVFSGLFLILAYLAALAVSLVAIAASLRCCFRHPGAPAKSPVVDAFLMGAGLYLGTFLLGHNYDYRQIFLLFTIPQLGDWSLASDRPARLASRLSLISIMVSVWYTVLPSALPLGRPVLAVAFALDLAATWTLYGALFFLLAGQVIRANAWDVWAGQRLCRYR